MEGEARVLGVSSAVPVGKVVRVDCREVDTETEFDLIAVLVALALKLCAPGGSGRHCPAVAAVVATSAQHAQAGQEVASSADGAQQHPPAHREVVQSNAEPQTSPGGRSTQAPEPAEHVEQPWRTAVCVQQ